MSEVPDKVIEEASTAGAEAAERARKGVVERRHAANRAFAGVIAAWARAEEQQRIKALLEDRAREAADDYRRDPGAYHRGREDELLTVVEEIGSADTREDGKETGP